MTAAWMGIAFLLAGICGDWIMGLVDRFLNKYVKGEEESESAPREAGDNKSENNGENSPL